MEKSLENIFSDYEGKLIIPVFQQVIFTGWPHFMPNFVLLPQGKISFQFAGELPATSGVHQGYLKKLRIG